jgi:hypothetical protein
MIAAALDTVRKLATRLEGEERAALEVVLAYLDTLEPSGHAASAYRSDDTVLVQSRQAFMWAEISKQHRELLTPSVERLCATGTIEALEDWCADHGPTFDHDLRGSDRQFIWRRLLKCAERHGVSADVLKEWMRS